MLDFRDIHPTNFESKALDLYRYQYEHNAVYRKFCTYINRGPEHVNDFKDIPFLPVELFKKHEITTGIFSPETVFTSSTTTGSIPSKHFIKDLNHYQEVYSAGFRHEYGPEKDWAILALLPNYLERKGSSLVAMVQGLMSQSEKPENGFYLYDHQALNQQLEKLREQRQPTLLFGVTFGLLDFAAENTPMDFPELRLIETGGMKGRRKELIRKEVHNILKDKFPSSPIDSEYGMTELLSQAYLKDSGLFSCPPWMRVYTRDIADPLAAPQRNGSRGALQVVDFANVHSCSFLALEDQGKVFENGTFEVYGRLDKSEIRGCNLMISL